MNQFFVVLLVCFLLYHFLEWFDRTTGEYFARMGERLGQWVIRKLGGSEHD